MFEPMLDSKTVGEAIAEIRKKKGMSQEVLSELAEIGRTHLSAITPVLMGITKASFATDSFLSAASFQETTRLSGAYN